MSTVGQHLTGNSGAIGDSRGFSRPTGTSTTIAPGRRRTRPLDLAIDLGALLGMLVLVTATFWPIFGGRDVWIAGLGGAVLGLGIGTLGWWRRLASWQLTAVGIVGYLLFGGVLALRSTTLSGVPTLRTLTELLFGAIGAWKGLLTVDTPAGGIGSLLLVPLISTLLAGAVGATVALRTSRPTWAWLAPALCWLLASAFGEPSARSWTWLLGVGFAVLTLVWTAFRRARIQDQLLGGRVATRWQPVALATAVLVVAGGVGFAAHPVLAADSYRTVLREQIVPPLDPLAYPSPLQGFRKNLSAHKEDTLLTVSGLPADTPVRIATLDAYDGISYDVADSATPGADSGLFKRMGSSVPDQTPGTRGTVQIRVDGYAGVWVPTVGRPLALRLSPSERSQQIRDSLFFNRASTTAISTVGVRDGDSYALDVILPPEPSTAQIKAADAGGDQLPDPTRVPDTLVDLARQWTGSAATAGEAAVQLEENFRRGFYSNGLEGDAPSRSGHSAARMQLLVGEDQMVGDEEQYSVAMALAARSLGMPARVVYGYLPQQNSGSAEVAIKGGDVTAWTEIQLQGLGWVSFHPAPDKSRAPQPDQVERESKPRPQVDNPPPPPDRPNFPPPDNTPPEEPQEDPAKKGPIDWAAVAFWAAVIGGPLLAVSLPVLLVLGLKHRRRTGRLLAERPTDRIAGGWSEVVDKARDLGLRPHPSATRSETAESILARFPGAAEGAASPRQLAVRADAWVFSQAQPADVQVDSFWSRVDEARSQLAGTVPWWRRVLGALSLRSLRRIR